MACCCTLFGLDEACHYMTSMWSDRTTTPHHQRHHQRPASTYKRVSMIQEAPHVMDTLNKWFGHNQVTRHHDDHYFKTFVIHHDGHLVTTFKAAKCRK